MLQLPATFLEELEELTEYHHELFVLKNPNYSRYSFHDKLRSVTSKHHNVMDKNSMLHLTFYWFDFFENTLFKTRAPSFHIKDIDDVIHFVLQHGLVPHILKIKEASSALACLCMIRVHLISHGFAHLEKDNVTKVLSQLTNTAASNTVVTSLKNTVTFLYGPACWELCHTDVETLTRLPNHIRTLSLPILNNASCERNLEPSCLPDDLKID